jgi:outer membrane biosynthesis protein TonB
MKKKQHRIIFITGIILLIGFCLAVTLVTMGSGLTLWVGLKQTAKFSPTAPRPTRKILVMPSPTLIGSMPSPGTTATPAEPLTAPTTSKPLPPDATVAPTLPPVTPTSPPLPTDTATPTPLPATPTPTPLPPTATPSPTPPPPTATDTPTATPTPGHTFTVSETEQFPTSHPNFDVYIAITDANNTPLSGYRVLGQHSGGLQVESQISANAWTANSGAMHYKAGNIKYEVPDSPGGVWSLQLVDEAGHQVAPSVELSFDSSDPTWYFVLYRQIE